MLGELIPALDPKLTFVVALLVHLLNLLWLHAFKRQKPIKKLLFEQKRAIHSLRTKKRIEVSRCCVGHIEQYVVNLLGRCFSKAFSSCSLLGVRLMKEIDSER